MPDIAIFSSFFKLLFYGTCALAMMCATTAGATTTTLHYITIVIMMITKRCTRKETVLIVTSPLLDTPDDIIGLSAFLFSSQGSL